ncbi:hypothetical protein CRUP_009567 [Coryphaenoides rupestris]|nr:hypothetical protein CRUP_009567 [Coryphaenoides rupestris]
MNEARMTSELESSLTSMDWLPQLSMRSAIQKADAGSDSGNSNNNHHHHHHHNHHHHHGNHPHPLLHHHHHHHPGHHPVHHLGHHGHHQPHQQQQQQQQQQAQPQHSITMGAATVATALAGKKGGAPLEPGATLDPEEAGTQHRDGKPPYSYASLITFAINGSPRKRMTLSEIYQWICDNFPYYREAGSGWKEWDERGEDSRGERS